MKTAIFATLLAGAAAFAPAQTGKASTALRAFEDEVSFCKFTYLVLEVSFDRGLQVTIAGGRNLVGIISGLHQPCGHSDVLHSDPFDRLEMVPMRNHMGWHGVERMARRCHAWE